MAKGKNRRRASTRKVRFGKDILKLGDVAFSGVYVIRNLLTKKVYVGSGVRISNRWSVHLATLFNNSHCNSHLQRAWNKYGAAAFEFDVIEKCPTEKLVEREQYWIDTLDAVKKGYNLVPKAFSALGLRHSDETIKQMCVTAKIFANTPEQKAMRSERAKRQHAEGNFGRATWSAGAEIAFALKMKGKGNVEALKEYWAKPSSRKRQSHLAKSTWATPEEMSRRAKCQIPGKKRKAWAKKSPEERAAHGRLIKEGMRRASVKRARKG